MSARDDYPTLATFGVPGSSDAAEAAAALDEIDWLRTESEKHREAAEYREYLRGLTT